VHQKRRDHQQCRQPRPPTQHRRRCKRQQNEIHMVEPRGVVAQLHHADWCDQDRPCEKPLPRRGVVRRQEQPRGEDRQRQAQARVDRQHDGVFRPAAIGQGRENRHHQRAHQPPAQEAEIGIGDVVMGHVPDQCVGRCAGQGPFHQMRRDANEPCQHCEDDEGAAAIRFAIRCHAGRPPISCTCGRVSRSSCHFKGSVGAPISGC